MRARDDAVRARDDAVRGRDDAVRARDDAVRGRDDAVRARDDALVNLSLVLFHCTLSNFDDDIPQKVRCQHFHIAAIAQDVHDQFAGTAEG